MDNDDLEMRLTALQMFVGSLLADRFRKNSDPLAAARAWKSTIETKADEIVALGAKGDDRTTMRAIALSGAMTEIANEVISDLS